MSNERGISCIKGYGMISFVVSGNVAMCPVNGANNCTECKVITKGEAIEQKQVKKEEEKS